MADLSHIERLPDPTWVTPPPTTAHTSGTQDAALCHGCGRESSDQRMLHRCAKCKRVAYCSKECQILDWKAPRNHRHKCLAKLLDLAMNNLKRLPLEEKMALLRAGQRHLVPNHQFSQTVAKATCKSRAEFLECLEHDMENVRVHFLWGKTFQMAAQVQGSFPSHLTQPSRYGLDAGVEALCAAINLWPGVHTIDSCSGIHQLAWVEKDGGIFFMGALVQFVSDNADALNQIQAIIERGALGIRFQVDTSDASADVVGHTAGFVVIDCDIPKSAIAARTDGDSSNTKQLSPPQQCRTYGRAVFSTREAFDKLDALVWKLKTKSGGAPLARMHNNLIGLVGLAIEIFKANPHLPEATPREKATLQEMEQTAIGLRQYMIHTYAYELDEGAKGALTRGKAPKYDRKFAEICGRLRTRVFVSPSAFVVPNS